jgi:Tol biopolymer transport system component
MPAFIGRVIYISCDANFAICNLNTMNADGSNRKIILKGGNDFVYPAWSPDGKQIAFEIKDQINVINPDGSGKQRLTNAKYAAISPEWSADNSQIVYYQLMDLTMVNNLDL